MPKGGIVRTELQNFMQSELLKRGYSPVFTPHIGSIELYKKSGHFPYYKESQYPTIKADEEEEYLLKPMNCPHHIEIYAAENTATVNSRFVWQNLARFIVMNKAVSSAE